ncbi:hypothetical protein Mapa_000059, partial [Marchantia paleacea]
LCHDGHPCRQILKHLWTVGRRALKDPNFRLAHLESWTLSGLDLLPNPGRPSLTETLTAKPSSLQGRQRVPSGQHVIRKMESARAPIDTENWRNQTVRCSFSAAACFSKRSRSGHECRRRSRAWLTINKKG